MAKKNDVTAGLDPDLFDEALGDDEADNEEVEEANEEETAEEGKVEEAETAGDDESSEEDEPSEEEDKSSEEAQTEEPAEESAEEQEAPDATDKAMAAAPKRRGRPPKTQAANDTSSDIESVTATYEVQRGFTATDGKTYHPGDVLPIQCRHCALWEREWLGKKRCQPGRRLDVDTVMHADRYSCGAFFICKEYDPELTTFLNMSLPEILTVRSMLPGIRKILQSVDFLNNWVERNSYQGDAGEVFANAKGFVTTFNSEEQLRLAEGFIREYAKVAAKRARDKRPPRPKYEAGDWVEWKDSKTGQKIEGIILSKARGNIWLAGVKAHQGQKFTYKYKEWKANYSPVITRKTAQPE